jgi:hypothetical protein
MAALQAETRRGGDLAAAIAAGPGQRSSTLLAEPRLGGVFMLTIRAFHSRPHKTQAGNNTKLTSRSIGNKAIVPVCALRHRALKDIDNVNL